MGISFAISKDRHSYSDTEINADMGAACFMETLLKSRKTVSASEQIMGYDLVIA